MPLFSKSMVSRAQGLLLRVAAAGAAVALVGTVGERQAAAGEVVVRVAPPAARFEVRGPAPSPHHVWAPGYWGWREGRGHVWYGGRWMAGRPGYAWEPAHWSARGGYYHFVGGHWRR